MKRDIAYQACVYNNPLESAPRGSTPRTQRLALDAANRYYGRFTEAGRLTNEFQPDDGDSPMLQDGLRIAWVFNHLTPVIRPDELITGAKIRQESPLFAAEDRPTHDGPGTQHPGGLFPDGTTAYPLGFVRNTPPDRPDLQDRARSGLYSPQGCYNHKVCDYFSLIKTGTQALVERAETLAAERTGRAHDIALIYSRCHKALIGYASRYADALIARSKTDLENKDELLNLASICRKVPANPAETFHEALQSFWFLYMISGDGIGRPDNFLYPYYLKDINAGILTQEKAQELIECLLIKLHGDYCEGITNVSSIHTMTLGGMNPDGTDSVNPLTNLFLSAIESVRLLRPSIYIRVNDQTPRSIIEKGVAMLARGIGQPAFYCDNSVIKGLTGLGISLETARGYCLSGCAEVVPGDGTGNWGAPNGWINIALVTDIALRRLASLPPLSTEDTSACMWQLIREEMENLAKGIGDNMRFLDENNVNYKLEAMLSMPVCLENGNSPSHGGLNTYMSHWEGIGLPNAAEMAAAAVLFADRGYALSDVYAMADNADPAFDILKRSILRFGNDQPVVDTIAARLVDEIQLALRFAATPLRPHAIFGHLSGAENMHIAYGMLMGATLDGRKAGETLADSLAGTQGMTKSGPTALLRSLCVIDHSKMAAGNVSTVRLNKADVKDQNGICKIASLIKTYAAMGGSQLQFNFIDVETLRAAQADPMAYEGLIIRVAGYSADFTHLGHRLQDEVIQRMIYEA